MGARKLKIAGGGIDRSALRKNTDAYLRWVDMFIELASNIEDAGGTEVTFKFMRIKRKPCVLIWGNGPGVSNWLPFVSLLNSPSESDLTKRGKMGSGSKSPLRHGQEVTYQSLRRGASRLQQLSYTAEQLVTILHDGVDPELLELEIPAGCPLTGSGLLVTLTGIGKGPAQYVDPKEDRSFKRAMEDYSTLASRSLAHMTTFIDERGRKHKVKPRELDGELIELTGEIPGLGPIGAHVSVASKPNRQERLSVWSHDRACTMGEFLRQAARIPSNRDLALRLLKVLDVPLVLGEVSCKGFGPHHVRGANTGFMQSLYNDEETVFLFLQWLQDNLVPKVLAIMGAPEPEQETTDSDLCRELVQRFQQIGEAPKDNTDTHDLSTKKLSTDPTVITLECGDSCWISIDGVPDGTTVRWDPSRSGGTLDRTSGKRRRFTAGSNRGKFKLHIHVGKVVHAVQVELFTRLTPKLRQRTRTGAPDQIITHTLDHTGHIKGTVQWRLNPPNAGTLQIAEDTFSCRHRLPGVTSKPIEIFPTGMLDDGTKMNLKGMVMVAPPSTKPRESTPRKRSAVEWVLDGHTYALKMFRGGASKDLESCMVDPHDDEPYTTIYINLAHPKFQGSPTTRQRVAEVEIADAIAGDEMRRKQANLRTHRTLSAEDMLQTVRERANELFVQLIQLG